MLKEKVSSGPGKDAKPALSSRKPADAVDSLKTQLEQALQVRDGDMLNSLLSVQDEDVLTSTTKDLPAEILEQLIATLCDRLRSDPSKSRDAVRWLKHTLRGNIYLVASSQQIKEALSGIGSVLSERGQMLHNVVKIKGKVEHLVESRKQAREAARAAIQLKNTAPLVVIKGGVVQTATDEIEAGMDEEDPEDEQADGLEGIDDEVDDQIDDEDLEENMYQEDYENEGIGEGVDDELDDDEDQEGDDDDVEEQVEKAKLKAKFKARVANGKRN